MSISRSARRSLLLGVSLAVATAGCGSSSGSSRAAKPTRANPPIEQTVTPLLAPFGLAIQRSSIDERSGSIGGSELSVYVRPARTEAAAVYANRFTPLASSVIPALFEKYRDIDWIDLCQEPAKSSGTWETVPVTRLEVSRAGAGRVDWTRVDLAALLESNRTHPRDFSIEYHNGVGRTPVWKAAVASARTRSG